MSESDLLGIINFLKSAEQLKNTLRNSRTSTGRIESTAEHTWRICLMVLVFAKEYEDIDLLKLLKMVIVHDLGEAVHGDIPAVEQTKLHNKNIGERKDLQYLVASLPNHLQKEILALWDEYDLAVTREAVLAKSMDKLETILQHNQGVNPPDFDYSFNLTYGKKFTDKDPLMSRFRALLDEETRRSSESREE